MNDKKCNYCYTDSDGYINCLPTPGYCRQMHIYKQGTMWFINGGNDIRLEIHYCPMCGRELKDDSKTI